MSFLDKLKKSMGVVEEKTKKKNEALPVKNPVITELKVQERPLEQEPEEIEKEKVEDKKEKWFKPEGQLAIDIYQTETDLIIQTAIAGVGPEDLNITMERDIVIIKGIREKPFVAPLSDPHQERGPRQRQKEKEDYFIQECYWGPFSREVILPAEIDPNRTEAIMQEGILTIRMPKILKEKKREIKIKMCRRRDSNSHGLPH